MTPYTLILDRHTAGLSAASEEQLVDLDEGLAASMRAQGDPGDAALEAGEDLSLSLDNAASSSDSSDANLLTLYVGNLSQAVDEASLFKKFAELGFVTSVQVCERFYAMIDD